MAVATMKDLLEAGIHFGHQTRRWNPKMKRYIFGARNGIYILDLQKSLRQLSKAAAFVRDTVASGGNVLFVGTKKQAQEAIQREAERCGMYYVNSRWLGGTLTNFETIKVSIRNLIRLEEMESTGEIEKYSKKEAARLRKQRNKLAKNLCGIKSMPGLPKVMFVIDAKKEAIAVAEARRLGIPCVGIVDTNCDPDAVDLPIPGNDDAIRAVNLFCSVMANAVLEGRAQGEKRSADAVRAPRFKQMEAPVAAEQEEPAAEEVPEEAPAEVEQKADSTETE